MTDPSYWETLSSQHAQLSALWGLAGFLVGSGTWLSLLIATVCMVLSGVNLALCWYAWRIKRYMEGVADET